MMGALETGGFILDSFVWLLIGGTAMFAVILIAVIIKSNNKKHLDD
jgi:hypothetical protein